MTATTASDHSRRHGGRRRRQRPVVLTTTTVAIRGCRGGIVPRPTRGAVVAAPCPDGLLPRALRGEQRGGGSPCRSAANDADNDGHIGDVRANGVVKDDGDDDNLDDDDNDDEGEDKNRDDNDDNAVVSGESAAAAAPTTRMAATMATSTKVTWTTMSAATTTTTSMTSTMTTTTMGDGTTTMRWRQRQWNDDNLMAMETRALCHPSEATISLCRQFGEESTRERDNFGGRKDRKGSRWKQLGGDHFISTRSIPNQLSAHPRAEEAP